MRNVYASDGASLSIDYDSIEFFKEKAKDGHHFYFLISSSDHVTRKAFVKSILDNGTSPEGNASVLGAVLEVDSNGRIVTGPLQSPNANLSEYLEHQTGGRTVGGLWVNTDGMNGIFHQDVIKSAAVRVQNIASIYRSLDAGRNPPETFISLTSRDLDLNFSESYRRCG